MGNNNKKKIVHKDRFAVGSADWVRQESQEMLNSAGESEAYAWVKDVFPDSVIVDVEVGGMTRLYKMPYAVAGNEITFGEMEEVAVEYVAKRRASADGPELTGPIVEKNEAKRLAFAAVLVPGEPDSDGEVLTAEKIADVAHAWLADYGNVDLQHSLNNVAVPVESYVTDRERIVTVAEKEMVLPEGSWILGSRIDDDGVWAAVLKGELTGYSVMGVARAALKSKDAAFKRTLLRDLGDWVAPFVSVVDAPAVPKAKFFAIKEKAVEEDETPVGSGNGVNLWRRVFGAKKEETEDMKKEEVQEIVTEALKEIKIDIEGLKAVKADATPETLESDGAEAIAEVAETAEKSEGTADEAETVTVDKGEFEAMKSAVDELTAKINSRSRAIKSDEGETAAKSEEKPDRDAFGRKIRG